MEDYGIDQHDTSPLLTLTLNDDNNPIAIAAYNFDYAAFLGDQDLDYLAETESPLPDSSAGGNGSVNATPPSASSSSAGQLSRSQYYSNSSDNNGSGSGSGGGGSSANRRQRLERRGHTKSRRGCYNCKRRRIKCQETRPACGHCVKTGLNCEYPTTPLITHQPQHQVPLFSLQDMRFFQHFLQTCFPTHPLGNESIWTHEVPCLAQNYEYLMHAILGLSASELMVQDPSLVTFAMMHRLQAIKAIKKTLAGVPRASTFEEGNALMATCFALTFQSVCLDDGMAEFMTFCRGIVLVAIQMYCKGSRFIFQNFVGEDQMALLQPKMEKLPPIRRELTDGAVASLRALEPLLTRSVDREYHDLLVQMAEMLYTDSFAAYRILCQHYGWWMQIPHEQFQHVIDPTDQTMVVLAAHWIALKQVMAPITSIEHEGRTDKAKAEGEQLGMIRWLRHLNRSVPLSSSSSSSSSSAAAAAVTEEDVDRYMRWPRWVEAQLERDLGCFGRKS
ncbi:RNA polymerase II-specific transcription factor-like protein [Microdochium nivale]|nr:RNA polymerase II-specific transcription factor-like protein [Microdochium nivale]